MKKLLFGLGLFGLFSCGDAKNESEQVDSVNVDVATAVTDSSATENLCFLMTEGDKNQDSTKVSLSINGADVSGSMDWIPDQKDGAYGTIIATKDGDIIRGIYAYSIEGSEQTEEVEFKLEGGKLWKKSGEMVEKIPNSGELVFKDASKAEFKYELKAVNCN